MSNREMPTQAYLKEIFKYDINTGVFVWNPRPPQHFVDMHAFRKWNTRYAGKEAGTYCGKYKTLRIDRVGYYAHRIAWKYVTGEEPTNQIDHIDLRKANNQFSNLREATNSENGCNSKIRPHSKTGFKGVHYHKRDNRYQASITINGKRIGLGCYKTAEQAHSAYVTAAHEYRGEFANSG